MKKTSSHIDRKVTRLLARDPLLSPYRAVLKRRLLAVEDMAERLQASETATLADMAAGHTWYGLHPCPDGWVFREWAPNATALFLVGDMSAWQVSDAFALERINTNGDWELRLPRERIQHGMHYRLHLVWPGGCGDRIPAWTRRVVQDPVSNIFTAQVWQPTNRFSWQHPPLRTPGAPLLIYEAHVGMAQEDEKVGTFREFTRNVLPRVAAGGYNTLQLMALPEHPYYASFGYQVSSFFAATSRFGTPEELKELIDTAHGLGLRVLMDIVHSHTVANEVEGLACFDGTAWQYFHKGSRGRHPAWGTCCFDYGKPQVLHFLLSSCRFWMDEYRVDGFRFDGVTSMLYRHHGLERTFTSYDDYFDDQLDEDALVYLTLANRLIHQLDPGAVSIAEEVSGLPGLAAPQEEGGIGFDYRFAMGIPDYWIRLTKQIPDEQWPLGNLWYELTNRRPEEKTISYAESHDQALVGDQTLIFRLLGDLIYTHMQTADPHLVVARGMALHKMIRLVTLATAGSGYLTFMGNEFGHPEWIDFPREGNNWSYRYARRQWHLADHPDLKYRFLSFFDRDILKMVCENCLFETPGPQLVHLHQEDKILAFRRGKLLLVFNFHPQISFTDYALPVGPAAGYRMILDTDNPTYGGHARLTPGQRHETRPLSATEGSQRHVRLYLPSRTALVLAPEVQTL